jgi:ABC-type molybdate transport system substrate-binding protein
MEGNATRWMLGVAATAMATIAPFVSHAWESNTTNINLAVASNFYGVPPSNSAITDIINAFQAANPKYTVTVVDNGATGTLVSHIIDGNKLGVDLFLAADTETPLDLLTDYPNLVTPYNSASCQQATKFETAKGCEKPLPLFIFNYAQGILVLLSNTPGVDLSCFSGTCGYDPNVYKTVAIADPSLAPYGVAAQSVLTGRYGLKPPLSSNPLVHEYPNITATFNAVIAKTDPVGFVAMSSTCSNGKYPTPGNGTSALACFTIESNSKTPGLLFNNYNPLTQAGIPIKNQRNSAQETELTAFVEFMTDFTQPPSPDSPMMMTLKKFCYSAP